MALDGILLHCINNKFSQHLPLKIQKIKQVSDYEIVIECYGNEVKESWLVSLDSISNRFCKIDGNSNNIDKIHHFVLLMRKYLENGLIVSSCQIDLDRILCLEIKNRNELKDEVTYFLYIELMGQYNNLILVYNNIIVDAFNRIYPSDSNQRILLHNVEYKLPSNLVRANPFCNPELDHNRNYVEQLDGFSSLLSKELQYRVKMGQNLVEMMKEISDSDYVYDYGNKVFHCLKLSHLNKEFIRYPLISGLDSIYANYSQKQKVAALNGNLIKKLNREIKRLTKKLTIFKQQLKDVENADKFLLFGDLLMTYGHQIKKGDKEFRVLDFENNWRIIPIDPKYNVVVNANKYYQKYRKLKTSLNYILQQEELTLTNIDYYQNILVQLESASVLEIKEIENELIDYGLLRVKNKSCKNGARNKKINIHQIDHDGYTYFYGKSNVQNNYLTFSLAHKNYWWFHVLDGSGGHVVINSDVVDEPKIRFASNLAALLSKHANSSSVPVQYTQIQYIKKIPKAPLGKVLVKKYQTIYIDPVKIEL